ncbi:uncharacterized protein PFL1_01104 [Pseudozyma flocculosa PF-1]|uniref:uncharacterized protein n=1 Tax=Pseudozyma flocculosa PF-1 TaxID=1277687 RepID=UPI0004561AAA|nr:uncharacterized protein PFL1_01104 [Pseudozyma flocculosa PF-1]EPQ31772.1 hypothetical protein PFL1_01104 [Pseudozyma flocculosa PF-1]
MNMKRSQISDNLEKGSAGTGQRHKSSDGSLHRSKRIKARRHEATIDKASRDEHEPQDDTSWSDVLEAALICKLEPDTDGDCAGNASPDEDIAVEGDVVVDDSSDKDCDEDIQEQEGTQAEELDVQAECASAASERALKSCDDILSALERLPEDIIGLVARKDAARRLATKNEERQTTFIVRGPAGSGKSTLINTILGEEIMPTSSNEACTTVPTKILYSSAPDEYRAEIQFVAKDEWTAELQAYCTARRQESDTLPSNGSAPASAISTQLRDKSLEPWDATEARFSLDATIAKLSALFPRETWDDFSDRRSWTAAKILALNPAFKKPLGVTRHETAACAGDLRELLSRYDDPRRCRIWPLITEIRVYLPSSVLRHGAALVDLPGTGDCNAACNEAAARYIRDYDFMWVCLDICRAKSNKEMEAVFADLSDEQLQSGRGRISFVLTKCEQGCKILDKGSIRPIHQDVPSLLNDPVFNKKHREYQAVVEATRQMQKRVGGSGRAPRKATKSAILELEALSNTKRDCRRQLARLYCRARSKAVATALMKRYHDLTHRLVHQSNTTHQSARLIFTTATEDFEALGLGYDTVASETEDDTEIPHLQQLIERA